MNSIIRPATPNDAVPACSALRRSIIECAVADHQNNTEILEAWLRNKTPQNIASWFAARSNYSVVAVDGEKIVGVGMMSEIGEIMLCYVVPEARFTGAGKALLHAMEEHATTLKLSEIILTSTGTAKEFYTRNGFAWTGDAEMKFGVASWPMRKSLVAV